MAIAFITGVTGQDGSYLAEFLLNKGYEVHGLVRKSSTDNLSRLQEVIANPKFIIHYGDLTDASSLMRIIAEIKPDEIYNLGAQSDVKESFDNPYYTLQVDGVGYLNILECVRILNLNCKIYQASTSELFGNHTKGLLDENSELSPETPYACAKLYAYHIGKIYRKSYKMFICNGIAFNHESERRGECFLTRKITKFVASLTINPDQVLYLGNLSGSRDRGDAKEYVQMMWKMLQQEKPDDYVLATGHSCSVREFCILAFQEIGIDLEFVNSGLNEIAKDKKSGKTYIKVSPLFFRPNDVLSSTGNSAKAREELGFKNKTTLKELVHRMVENDINEYRK